jgi:malonyl CoA-acyl carrier protein transacylase/phosphopantetheinyl transferase
MMTQQAPDCAWRDELIVLAGDDRFDLVTKVRLLLTELDRMSTCKFKELALSLNEDFRNGGVRLAVVAHDQHDLKRKSEIALPQLEDHDCRRIRDRRGIYFFDPPIDPHGEIAFLFPGEGSQYENMLADLAVHFPEVRETFDLIDRAFAGDPSATPPSELIFPPRDWRGPGGGRLFEMDTAATAVFAANLALFKLLTGFGVKAQAMAGHSTGEYSALYAAGAMRFRSDAELIERIANLNTIYHKSRADGIPEGTLVAIGGVPIETIRRAIESIGNSLHIAMHNCPNQYVIFGYRDDIDAMTARLRGSGGVLLPLNFGRAYHTPLFACFSNQLRPFLDDLDFCAPATKLWSCATAAPFPVESHRMRDLALAQWTRPVRFQETIEAMYQSGVRIFVEVGPRGNLANFVRDILQGREFLAVPLNVTQRSGIGQLCHVLALLSAQHRHVALDRLYAVRQVRRVSRDAMLGQPAIGRGGRVRLSLGLPLLALPSLPKPSGAQIAEAARIGGAPQAPVPEKAAPPATASTPVSPGRVEVMRGYQRTMHRFVVTQKEVVTSSVALMRNARRPADVLSRHPLIDRIVSLRPGREVVAERCFSVSRDPFLRDHMLGGQVSDVEADLHPLAIMPLTMSMELMTQTAAILRPEMQVVGLHAVRAHRWIAFEENTLTLRVSASCSDDAVPHVAVRVDVEDAREGVFNAVEGTVRFSIAYPTPDLSFLESKVSSASSLATNGLYAKSMFSGPRFRSVKSLDSVSPEGASGVLETPPDKDLLQIGEPVQFRINPVLLDGAGQVVGFWTAARLTERFVIFPVSLGELTLHGPPLPAETQAKCHAQIRLQGNDAILSTIYILAPDGRVNCGLKDWVDKRFDLTPAACAFVLSPRDKILTSRILENPSSPELQRDANCRIADSLDPNLAPFSKPIWQEVLARLILSRTERTTWREFKKMPPMVRQRRALPWLLSRLAAKDAVRSWVKDRAGPDLLPADIEIGAVISGRLTVTSPLVEVEKLPTLSISHCGPPAAAAAIACDSAVSDQIGIDIERAAGVEPAFVEQAFDGDERKLLASMSLEGEWFLRGWTSKEAAGKATSAGGRVRPLAWRVSHANRETGVLYVARPDLGAPIRSETTLHGGVILATVVLQQQDALEGSTGPREPSTAYAES